MDLDLTLHSQTLLWFLNFELDLHPNLDLNLDSNKLDLGLGLELARGQRSGAPKPQLKTQVGKILGK